MGRKWMVLIAVMAVLFLSATAFAQMDPSDDPRERPMRNPEQMGPSGEPQERPMRNRAQMWKRIEMMKMWKLTEALNLDEKTAAKLFPMIHEHDQQQWKLRQARHQIMKDMKAELEKEKPDSAALANMTDAFKQNERDMVDARNKALTELSKVLTKEQVAEMIIAIPKFEHEVRKWMYEARARRMGHGMGRGGRGMCMQCGGECPCPMHPEGSPSPMRPETCPLGKGGMQKGPMPAEPSAEGEQMPDF